MQHLVKPRMLGMLGVVLATQLLSACVVVPARHYRHRPVVIDGGHPGYGAPYPRDYRHPREYRDPRDYRYPQYRGNWDGRH